MDLVDEQDGAVVEHHEAVLCLIDLSAQVLDGARNGGDLHELALGVRGDDMRQRGLARTCGSVQNHTGKHVVLDGGSKPGARAHGLLLTHVIIERRRAHANRKRCVLELFYALVAGK